MAATLTSCQIELRSLSGLAEQLTTDMDSSDKMLIQDKIDHLRKMLNNIRGNLGDKQRELEKR